MAVSAGQDQPFPCVNSFLDFIYRFECLLTCPASNNRLQEPTLLICDHMLICDHILCRMCTPTSKSVVCPKCNIISRFKDVRQSILMEEMVKIAKEVDSSTSDIPEELVLGNVSIAAKNSSASMPDEKKLVLLGCALNPHESVIYTNDNFAFCFLQHDFSERINACLQEGRLMPEEPYEVNHDLRGSFDGPKKGRIRVTNKAPKLFGGLGFFLSSYLEPLIRTLLEKVLVATEGTVIEEEDLHLPTAALGDESLKKYIVINEVEPVSSGDISNSIDERSEEVVKNCRRTGSPRFICYRIIADAIAALDSTILDKEYGRDQDALICKPSLAEV